MCPNEQLSFDESGSTARDKLIALPIAGPWRRFFARQIDLWTIGLIVGIAVGLSAPFISSDFSIWIQNPENNYTFGWLLLPLVLLAEAAIFGIFGSTPGKALLGLKVITVAASKPSFLQYVKRLASVYWYGLGTGFPIVALFTMAAQYKKLNRGQQTGYDQGKFNVKALQLGTVRVIASTCTIIALTALFVLVIAFDAEESNNDYQSSLYWINEVNRYVVPLPAGWIHEKQENSDNQPIEVFNGPGFGITAIFAVQELQAQTSVTDYATQWVDAVKSEMTITLPGENVVVEGNPSLHLTGVMTNDPTIEVRVTITKEGPRFWRFLWLGYSGNDLSSDAALELRKGLFKSINFQASDQ